jgi:hypothetical protein
LKPFDILDPAENDTSLPTLCGKMEADLPSTDFRNNKYKQFMTIQDENKNTSN